MFILDACRNHVTTVWRREEGGMSWAFSFVYLTLPIAAAGLAWFSISLPDKALTALISCVTFLSGFLLTVLIRLHTDRKTLAVGAVVDPPKDETISAGIRRVSAPAIAAMKLALYEMVFFNIIFCILCGLVTVAVLISIFFIGDQPPGEWRTRLALWANTASFYLGTVFILTFFLILKRLYRLFEVDFDKPVMG